MMPPQPITGTEYELLTCAIALIVFGAALYYWLRTKNLGFGRGTELSETENPLLFWMTVAVTCGFLFVVALSALSCAAQLLLS
jgi:hypothetical protein